MNFKDKAVFIIQAALSKLQDKNSFIFFVFFLYVILRIGFVLQIEEPKIYPDTARYFAIAQETISTLKFWAGPYPVAVPLVLKLFSNDPVLFSWFQTLFSIFAWSFLAISLSRIIKTAWLQKLTFLLILVLSLERVVALWDWVVLSESMSGSLLVSYLGMWIWYLNSEKHTWYQTVLLGIIGVLWMFTRDTNAVINLILVAYILVKLFYNYIKSKKKDNFVPPGMKTHYSFLISTFVFTFFISSHFANMAGRWIGPSMSVVGTRVLTNSADIDFFQNQGMPINDALLSFAGKEARAIDAGFGDDPALDEFHQWYRENGKIVLIKYILSTPVKSFLAPLQNIHFLINTDYLTYYKPLGFQPILPPPLEKIFFFEYLSPLTWSVSLLSFLGAAVFLIRNYRKRWEPLIFLLLFLYPHAFLIWHISACNMERHAYQFRIHFNLAVLLSILFVADQLMQEYQSKINALIRATLWQNPKVQQGSICLGVLLILTATFMDFLTGSPEFSVGYAQLAGILTGLGFTILGIWLQVK